MTERRESPETPGVCVCVFVVYDVLTGAVVARLSGHDACVRDVSWHPYEDNIISSSVSALNGNCSICPWPRSSIHTAVLLNKPNTV